MVEIIRATRAYIDLDALRQNLENIRKAIPVETTICAAVKANAYGHGVLPVAEVLRGSGVEVLGVSSPFEGRELRRAGDQGRILLFGPTVPEEIPLSISSGLEIMMTSESYFQSFQKALNATPVKEPVEVHLKIDTGMGRVGCLPDEAVSLASRISSHQKMKLAGITTHFPSADSTDPLDLQFTRGQAQQLLSVIKDIKSAGINPGVIHAANSGGIALSPQTAFGMVRPGIALYGYGTPLNTGIPLKPVMELKTRITALKKVPPGTSISYGRTWTSPGENWIATLPIGYADGYPRLLSNRGEVLIAGKRYKIAGTVCMDQTMVNLGEKTDIQLNDEVTLFGPSPEGPNAGELAGLSGTIS
ncbi:MAG: alanine racemase, partial [Spirochaetaceae bacterium]|nr:alanine racemase [Spirochaetaceae bacterium]